MEPFEIRTSRLVLDQPERRDVDAVIAACSDPLFERFMVTPWPYRREHAEFFVDEFVPRGWAGDLEWTWAIREAGGAPLLGAVGVRPGGGTVGYWLGAPGRGRGVMVEALGAAADAVLARTPLEALRWECVAGNAASARVARRAGFRFTGRRRGGVTARDGAPVDSWTAELRADDDRAQQEGWPV